jgi:hypothetical protein
MPIQSDFLLADITQRLRETHADRTFDVAQMHLINLPEIINAAGRNWPKLKDKLRADSVKFLKACLEEDDLVIPAGDGFLIDFARGEPAEVKLRGDELRDVLLEFYRGQEEFKNLGISVAHRQIAAKEIGAMFAPPPPPSAGADTHACVFAPVWSARAQLIASYFCVPMRGARAGYDEGYAEEARHARRDYVALDLRLLDLAQAALESYSPDDVHPIIGISVHATTMQHRGARGAFLDRLAKISPELMKHVIVSIAEIEPGAPLINLADWSGMLRARAQHVLLEFHHSEAAPDLSNVGVWGAGYRAAPRANEEGAESGPHARRLGRWGDSLSRRRIAFYMADLHRPEMVRQAAQAGAQFFTSNTLWPFAPGPGGVVSAPAPFPPAEKAVSSAPS